MAGNAHPKPSPSNKLTAVKLPISLATPYGMWAPYDELTHLKNSQQGAKREIEKVAYHSCSIDEWEDEQGEMFYYIRQIDCSERLRQRDLTTILALVYLGTSSKITAHREFGNGRLPLPSGVLLRDDVSRMPNDDIMANLLSDSVIGTKFTGSGSDVGYSNGLNIECSLDQIHLSKIAELVYGEGSNIRDDRKMQEVRGSLARLSRTSIRVFRVTSKDLAKRIADGDLFRHLDKMRQKYGESGERDVMNELISEWEGNVQKSLAAKLIQNTKTTQVTVNGKQDRIYNIRFNPMLAASIAYGRSTKEVLKAVNGVMENGTYPGFINGFIRNLKYDVEIRRKVGVKSERMLAVMTAVESRAHMEFASFRCIDSAIEYIYGADYFDIIGTTSKHESERKAGQVKLENVRYQMRQTIKKLVEAEVLPNRVIKKVLVNTMPAVFWENLIE